MAINLDFQFTITSYIMLFTINSRPPLCSRTCGVLLTVKCVLLFTIHRKVEDTNMTSSVVILEQNIGSFLSLNSYDP